MSSDSRGGGATVERPGPLTAATLWASRFFRTGTARERWVTIFELAPTLIFLTVFLVIPLGVFFVYSFWTTSVFQLVPDWTLENYITAITDANYQSLFRNTLTIALMVGACTVVVAYTFAHIIRFHLKQHQETLLFLMLVSLFSGYLVRIYSWRTILGDQGIINDLLQRIGLIDEPLSFLLFSRVAVVLVLVNYLVPLAVLPIYASLQNVNEDEIEASRDLGAGAATTFWRVTLPLVRNGLFFSFAITVILAAGDYLTPQLVGGINGLMIGTVIADNFGATFNWALGAASSFVTTGCIVIILIVAYFGFRRVLR